MTFIAGSYSIAIASPELAGTCMVLAGAVFAWILVIRTRKQKAALQFA